MHSAEDHSLPHTASRQELVAWREKERGGVRNERERERKRSLILPGIVFSLMLPEIIAIQTL